MARHQVSDEGDAGGDHSPDVSEIEGILALEVTDNDGSEIVTCSRGFLHQYGRDDLPPFHCQ